MIGLSLLIIYLLLIILALFLNKDIFSPAKFYLLYLGVYFASIFIHEYSDPVYFNYIILCLFGLALILFEFKTNKSRIRNVERAGIIPHRKKRRAISIIWVITLIPIFAQIYLVNYMGGIDQYLNNIGLRVVLWRGMGIVLEGIKLMNILSLIYFSLLIGSQTKKRDWVWFALHFTFFLFTGLLSGGRGNLLGQFVLMIVSYHYLKKKVSYKFAFILIGCLLLAASFLGVVRNNLNYNNGNVSLMENVSSIFESSHFAYGIDPIELVYNNPQTDLEYGKTYLTVITNFVPRKIWPEKPDTGGVILTKRYTGDAWGGYSNLSTGIIAEGVINFGLYLGPLMGLMIYFLIMNVVFRLYKRVIVLITNGINSYLDIIYILLYVLIVTSMPNFLVGEWTNTMMGLILRLFKYLVVILTINLLVMREPIRIRESRYCNE